MTEFSPRQFLDRWFPSLAKDKGAAQMFWAYNELLSEVSSGKLVVLDDKLLFSGALAISGMPTPKVLLVVLGGHFSSSDSGIVSEEEAARLLNGKDAFFKTRTGWGGEGAFRLYADGTVRKADGSKVRRGLPLLLKKIRKAPYIGQEVVRQDARYSAVARASVNTVRCITWPGSNGAYRVLGATWRMGNGSAVVDNASSGGMFCGIDPETGVILGPARDLSGGVFETHPASGFAFAGSQVPDVQSLFEAAKAAHRVLGTPISIGWDLAMTPEGPTIVEGNGHWMPELHTLVDDGFEHRLWQAFMDGRKVSGSGFPQEKHRVRRTDMIRATLSIRGKVQGVGYRKWISYHARRLGVQAAPENLEDGSVRCHLIGQRWRIEFVVLGCHRGPIAAEVERIDVQDVRRLR